jgi:hypothetical protein
LTYRTVLTARSRKTFAEEAQGTLLFRAGSFLLHESTRREGHRGQEIVFFTPPPHG